MQPGTWPISVSALVPVGRLTRILLQQRVPLQQLQAHKGGKKCRCAQAHIGVPVGHWIGGPPALKLALDCTQAAVLLIRIRKHLEAHLAGSGSWCCTKGPHLRLGSQLKLHGGISQHLRAEVTKIMQ